MKRLLLLMLAMLPLFLHGQNVYSGYINCTVDPQDVYSYHIRVTLYSDSRATASDRPAINIMFGDGDSMEVSRQIHRQTEETFITENVYEITHKYRSAGTYRIYTRCGILNPEILNIKDPEQKQFYVETTLNIDPSAGCNSSPQFFAPPIHHVQDSLPVNMALGVYDIEGDSLGMAWHNPYTGLGYDSTYYVPAGARIADGILHWQPDSVGIYLFNLQVSDWRKGRLMSQSTYIWAMIVHRPAPYEEVPIFTGPCSDTLSCLFDARTSNLVDFTLTSPGGHYAKKMYLYSPASIAWALPEWSTLNIDSSGDVTGHFRWAPGRQPLAEQALPFVIRAAFEHLNTYQSDKLVRIQVQGHEPGCASYTAIKPAEFDPAQAPAFYPNPVKAGVTQLHILQATGSLRCTLYDAQGMAVVCAEVHNGTLILPPGELRAGIYFYRLQQGNTCTGSGKLLVVE